MDLTASSLASQGVETTLKSLVSSASGLAASEEIRKFVARR